MKKNILHEIGDEIDLLPFNPTSIILSSDAYREVEDILVPKIDGYFLKMGRNTKILGLDFQVDMNMTERFKLE